MIIDKTKTWNFATDSDNKSIYLIDSSRFIKKAKKNSKFDSIFKDKNEIFDLTPTLNENDYQENGTCWLNTMSAVGFLLEEQQNGLSIGKLRENFNIKRIKKSAKSKENIKPIISSEGLSSFEQGICDYSTEHFYPLTNISDKEKNIIKEFLRDKIEQNKVEQEELSTKSNRLEKLKEEQYKTKNLIIQGKYLKESLERITENDKKLKELCDKFDIKDIQCNKKQKSNQLSSRSSSNNTKRRKTKGRTMKSVVYLTI